MRNSQIILAKDINIDKNYNNVLNYTNTQMLELLQSQAHFIGKKDNCSFLGRENRISTSFTVDECLRANYIAFQNPSYSNKWFFAWIDDVIYKGESNTEIQFTIDSWTTWFGYWNIKPCFVLREHVNDDTIGLNTIPENLDVGEVVQESITEDLAYSNVFGYWIAVASNWNIKDGSSGAELSESDKGTQYAGITVYDNTVFGTQLFFFHITALSSFADLVLFLLRTNADGHIEDVQNIFILPDVAIDQSKLQSHSAKVISDENTFSFYTMSYDMSPEKFNTEIDKITSFSDYTPKNNKCFVYPYNYLFVSNNQGSNNIYKYEDFNTEKCIFENQFSIAIGGSGRIIPKNYKGMVTNDDEALALGKYPTCAWSSDAFTNWLTQNSVNMVVSLGLTAGSVATTIATGGATAPILAGAVMSVAGNIGNTIGQFYQASLLPNINGGQANGDVIWACNRNMFSFRQMRVKTEYLKIIDDFFTRFGYKINRLKIPNIVGRRYFNYIEISDSDEIGTGSVPEKYWSEINNACRKGVTIWHSHENVGNFNLDNTIVS